MPRSVTSCLMHPYRQIHWSKMACPTLSASFLSSAMTSVHLDHASVMTRRYDLPAFDVFKGLCMSAYMARSVREWQGLVGGVLLLECVRVLGLCAG